MRVLVLDISGHNPRYCDSKCHNAAHGPCHCICEGLLHGHGTEYARANAEGAMRLLSTLARLATTNIFGPALISATRIKKRSPSKRTG